MFQRRTIFQWPWRMQSGNVYCLWLTMTSTTQITHVEWYDNKLWMNLEGRVRIYPWPKCINITSICLEELKKKLRKTQSVSGPRSEPLDRVTNIKFRTTNETWDAWRCRESLSKSKIVLLSSWRTGPDVLYRPTDNLCSNFEELHDKCS